MGTSAALKHLLGAVHESARRRAAVRVVEVVLVAADGDFEVVRGVYLETANQEGAVREQHGVEPRAIGPTPAFQKGQTGVPAGRDHEGKISLLLRVLVDGNVDGVEAQRRRRGGGALVVVVGMDILRILSLGLGFGLLLVGTTKKVVRRNNTHEV